MKRFLLIMWYMRWISQYNNKYSRKSLESILRKVKPRLSNDVYSKIDISESIDLYYSSIFELIIIFDTFISGYKSFDNFNPNPYLRQLTRRVNALDYFTLDNNSYRSPIRSMESLIDRFERLNNLLKEETNQSILESKIRYSLPLFKDTLAVIEYYFIKLIDGEEIKKNF